MVARFGLCERSRLELAMADRLSQCEAEQLSKHLQACPHCRADLEELAGSQEWWQRARIYLSAKDDPGDADEDSLSLEEQMLEFLEPPERPEMLGRLGGYEIESIIGRGGMGVVLKGHDSALARTVAIKVLASPLATSAAARKRFAREARAAAAVVHDHVIPIYTVDTSGRVPFLVMPYITGRSLQDRLNDSGTLEVKEVLRIALQMARGLAAAHAQGLVHRDIKPANILLENGVERVRITDFGLARAIDDASQTQSGFIAGTPQYMSPEQARGESIDARADLFSLGSVMYAMCAGHPPFRAETTLAVLRRICDDEPRPIREINPDVPSWLASIIHRLLAKSPDERFQSAEEVADLLERWLAHLQQPTVIKPPSDVDLPNTTPLRRVMRRRMAAIACAIAVVVSLGTLAAWNWQVDRVAVPVHSPPSASATQHESESWSLRGPAPSARQELLSVQALDAELAQLQQAVHSAEAQLPTQMPPTFSVDEDVAELNLRLNNLENELHPVSSP